MPLLSYSDERRSDNHEPSLHRVLTILQFICLRSEHKLLRYNIATSPTGYWRGQSTQIYVGDAASRFTETFIRLGNYHACARCMRHMNRFCIRYSALKGRFLPINELQLHNLHQPLFVVSRWAWCILNFHFQVMSCNPGTATLFHLQAA
jgi:hypothetical protein